MNGSAIAASGLRKANKDKIVLDGVNRFRMPRVFRGVAVTALAAALLAGAATPGVAAADSRSLPKAAAGQDRPELQKAVQAFVDRGYAGLQMRVHDQRGEWVGSAGVRKLGQSAKPPTNGRFWVGSITKTFTATVVLQLVAEGKIGLDAPVAGYLPKLGLDRRITVRMLLRHTSGLFNYTGEYYDDGTVVPGIPAMGKEWVDNRFRTYRPQELVRLALSKPARFEPGTDQSYSNTNYTLALLLIEKVTGRSYAEEMQRRILRPLGLRGTVVPGVRTQLPGPHAHGYYRYQDAGQWKVVDVTRQNLSLLAGAGDMISTTQDLQTFVSALMGGKLLPAPLLAEMRKPHGKLGYGLGLFVQDLGPNCGGTVFQHNGSPPGGYGALMYSSPDGSKTLTASVTSGDAAVDQAQEFPKALEKLLTAVFCGGQAD
ncbi:D-alanyl-D-alanine carboxypeptidase [Nonomuraea muscovyensis]|uniref:D-alanyl-D-alanine carboxypeptidase n=1 Tax=Nonomuraea muscovyensis TaxID=1124761 RepID=A0A7X0F258_9ACTN|nr:serine hydrolase domain-containing protein [Nonomuraea muscovyensis]MBB6349940.1 D-alanyl-D-alanine carboxypeptidase [Nonomuraea muscovyensis]